MVRELVDPNCTLPEVRLNIDSPQDAGFFGGYICHFTVIKEPEGINVGSGFLQIDNSHKEVQFVNIGRNGQSTQKGIGLSSYIGAVEFAHNLGFDFYSCSSTLTADSARIWEILAERGAAQVIEPLAKSPIWEDKLTGKFVVPFALS